jgi:hypothetical protein
VGSIIEARASDEQLVTAWAKPIICIGGQRHGGSGAAALFAPRLWPRCVIARWPSGWALWGVRERGLGARVRDAMPSAAAPARTTGGGGLWHVATRRPSQLSSAPQGFLLDWGNHARRRRAFHTWAGHHVFGIAAACFMLEACF